LGASIYWDHYIRILITVKDHTGGSGWYQEHLSHGHYLPSFSPLVGQAWLLSHLVRNDPNLDQDAPWKSLVPYPVNLSEGWTRMRLDWWPLELAGENRSPEVAELLLALMVLATWTTGWWALRRPRRDEQRQPVPAA